MTVIYLVLPLAIVFSCLALGAFIWATRRGQFDDLDTPALRVLHDDAGRRK
jgi:cbb3-type cytochrome oxidase maturation protein